MLFYQRAERFFGLLGLILRRRGIHDGGIDHRPDVVHHRNLAARAVGGVKAHHDLAAHRRLQKQMLQVLPEHTHRLRVRRFGQRAPQLVLHRGRDEAVVRIGGGVRDIRAAAALAPARPALEIGADIVRVDLDAHGEEALPLAAVYGENAVRRHAAQRLGVVVIGAVNRVLFLFLGAADERTVFERVFAHPFADVGVVRRALGKDIHRALERGFGVGHALFGVRERQGGRVRVGLRVLRPEQIGQRGQARLRRNRSARAALGAKRAVHVVDLCHRAGRVQRGGDRRAQTALLFDEAADLLAPRLDGAVEGQPFLQRAQLAVVQRAGGLLPVARDEGDGIALVQQPDGALGLLRADAKLLREAGNQISHKRPPFAFSSASGCCRRYTRGWRTRRRTRGS